MPLTQVRCKRPEFKQWFSLFWQQVDALKYDGSFRVCYVPGQKIDSVTYVRGDASWTRLGRGLPRQPAVLREEAPVGAGDVLRQQHHGEGGRRCLTASRGGEARGC